MCSSGWTRVRNVIHKQGLCQLTKNNFENAVTNINHLHVYVMHKHKIDFGNAPFVCSSGWTQVRNFIHKLGLCKLTKINFETAVTNINHLHVYVMHKHKIDFGNAPLMWMALRIYYIQGDLFLFHRTFH